MFLYMSIDTLQELIPILSLVSLLPNSLGRSGCVCLSGRERESCM